MIRWYQAAWSPDHSPRKAYYPHGYCRYTPTCSEYGYQAIEKYGVVRGGLLAAWRVLRCNPLSKGGYDPVK
ncbi:membrane protein insertion efficiency factor YidD [Patescibacteria group bacterium]|nr:membrane protein insertion efficiency factor YidD [Patescibacteria group bacterium]